MRRTVFIARTLRPAALSVMGAGVGVGVGVGPDGAQYLPPALKKRWVVLLYPPQTIISLPAHTAKFDC